MPDPINIVIIGTDKTGAAFGSVSKGMASIGKSAQGTLKKGLKVGALAFAGLGIAATGAVAAIGAGIVKMTMDASQLEGVASTFDLLAQSIGSEMTPALEGMREATRGMVSDADLMQAGNKFMAMGLANTSEEMDKLSLIATQLGSAMGEGPTESMENFALMLANQSIPRLDSFGISSGAVRERIEELMGATGAAGMTQAKLDESIGKTRDKLEKYKNQLQLAQVRQGEFNEKTKESTRLASQMKIEELTKKIATEEAALSKLANTTASTGEATAGLTREQAFMQAVMEAAEVTMGKVGEQAGTSAASIARIQSTVENTALGIGQKFIPVLKEMLVPIADLVQKWGPRFVEIAGSLADWLGSVLPPVIEKVTGFLSELGSIIGELVARITGFGSDVFDTTDSIRDFMLSLGLSKEAVEAIDQVIWGLQDAISNLLPGIKELIARFTGIGSDLYDTTDSIREFLLALGLSKETVEKIDSIIWKLSETLISLRDAIMPVVQGIVASVTDFVTWKDVLIALGIGIASIVLPAIAGLLVSIGAVLAPVLLVIGAVAALRLAWESDFLGMRTVILNLWEAAGPAIASIISWFQDMIPVAIATARSAFEFLVGLWQSAIQPALAELGAAFAELWAALVEAWNTIRPIFAELASTIGEAFGGGGGEAIKFSDIVKIAVDGIVIVLKVLIAIVTVAAKIVGGAALLIGKLWEKHGKIVLKVLGFIAKGFKVAFDLIFKIVGTVLKAISKIWHKLFGNSELLESAFKFGQSLVRTFISFLGGVVSEIISFASEALAFFEKLFKDLIAKTIAGMRDFVAKIVAGLADALSKFEAWVSETIAMIITFFVDLVREAVQGLIKFVSEIVKGLADAISKFEAWIADVISAIITFFADLVREAISGLARFVSEIITGLANALAEFISWISNVLTDIATFFADLVSAAVSGLAAFVSEIISGLASALAEFISWISGVLVEIGTFFSDLVASAVSGLSEFVSAIISGLADAAAEFVSWGTDILTSVGAALQSIIDAVIAWASELYQVFRDALAALAAVPAEIADLLRQIGTDIINLVVEGIQAVGDFVSRVEAQIRDWFNTIYTNIASAFQIAIDLGKLIVLRIREGFEAVTDFVSNIGSQLSDWIGELVDTATGWYQSAIDVGEKIINQIIEGIGQMASNFRTFLWNWFIVQFENVFSPIPAAQHMGMQIIGEVLQGIAGQGDAFTNSLRNMMSSWVANASSGLTANISPALAGAGIGGGLLGAGGAALPAGPSFANTFNTNISSAIEEEEFYYRVQEAQRQAL